MAEIASTSRRRSRVLPIALTALLVSSPAAAQTQPRDLGRMSLEDLMNVEVTIVARKEQPARDVAAAIFVITQEDIARSGMTSVPDLLRLAPGVNVAQINGNKWAVSVRGFNGLEADKLLVLVDGRVVYNRLFAGVPWELVDLMVDDIERIEVIRGPAAALWGANAVNGVINIRTKSATDIQGTLVRVDAGNLGEQAVVRHGGRLGTAAYRAFVQWTRQDDLRTSSGADAEDGSKSLRSGLRFDWHARRDTVTVQGVYSDGGAQSRWLNTDQRTAATQPYLPGYSDRYTGFVLGRWTRSGQAGGEFQVQSFLDITDVDDTVADHRQTIGDVSLQYHSPFGQRHDIVLGGTYRFAAESLTGVPGFAVTTPDTNGHLAAAFVNDEISFRDGRVRVTLGAQGQYDSDAGAGFQPTVRVLWKLTGRQSLWAASSHALRTPSPMDRGVLIEWPARPTPAGIPIFVTIVGDEEANTETFTDVEGGYRADLGGKAAIDVTAFAGSYSDLREFEETEPVFTPQPSPRLTMITRRTNDASATTRGMELTGHWSPSLLWQVQAGIALFDMTFKEPPGRIPDALVDNTPHHQWQVRMLYSPTRRTHVAASLFGVGKIAALGVPGYTRTDVTGEWRLTGHIALLGSVYNLLDKSHLEFRGENLLAETTYVPRSARVRVRVTF